MLKNNLPSFQNQRLQLSSPSSSEKCYIFMKMLRMLSPRNLDEAIDNLSFEEKQKINKEIIQLKRESVERTPFGGLKEKNFKENIYEKQREISFFALNTKQTQKQSLNGEDKRQNPSKQINQFDSDYSYIDLQSEQEENQAPKFGNLQQIISPIKNMNSLNLLTPYKFEVSPFCDRHYFKIQGSIIEYTRSDQRFPLTKLVSKNAISKDEPQRIGIKILKTLNRQSYMYFGLENDLENKRKKSEAGGARTKHMISFSTIGGNQLHVFSGPKLAIPRVEVNDTLELQINYKRRTIKWFINNEDVKTLDNIAFEGREWFPFITMKYKGDQIQLINY